MSDYLTNNSMKETYRGYHPWWHPLERVIGRRSMTIQLPLSNLSNDIILKFV
jgi:hypothetical protein